MSMARPFNLESSRKHHELQVVGEKESLAVDLGMNAIVHAVWCGQQLHKGLS